MRSRYNFIVSTDNRYNNVKNLGEGKELIVNTEISERDYMFTNRIAKVITSPYLISPNPVEPGYEIIVHHNIFRQYENMRGEVVNSGSYISDDTFTVQRDEVFAYRKNKQDVWKAIPGYCFIKPINNKDEWSTDPEEYLKGELVYNDIFLEEENIFPGDIVGFTEDSEYEFQIDGEKLYRVYTKDITCVYGS